MANAYETHENDELAGDDASHATVAIVLRERFSAQISNGDVSFFSSSDSLYA